jgi:GT2 family glycosyltransferase
MLRGAVDGLAAQNRPADETWVAVTSQADLPDGLDQETSVRVVVVTEPGITIQRNAILDRVSLGVDLVVFLDDDVELHPDYLAQAEAFAEGHPEVVLFTGEVVVDGAATGEIDREAARRALERTKAGSAVTTVEPAYGCNMVVRREIADELRFDERLRLYGWLEDRDFSVRAARRGDVVRYTGCQVAHLGYSGARENGLRLGFQQTVHPEYLRRKGVLPLRTTLLFIGRALLANMVRRSSGRVDRAGRLRGNLLGLREIFWGDADPRAIHRLPA